MKIIKATIENLDQLIPLFEGYRKFYNQLPNPEVAYKFLSERFKKNDSILFMAFNKNKNAIGFTQLYPTFSSVTMQQTYILNDLYVVPNMRGNKVGENLLNHAKQFTIKKNCKGLTLETDIDNPAQKLYERLGWEEDTNVLHYTWRNK